MGHLPTQTTTQIAHNLNNSEEQRHLRGAESAHPLSPCLPNRPRRPPCQAPPRARMAVGATPNRATHAHLPQRATATDPGSSCRTAVYAHESPSARRRACASRHETSQELAQAVPAGEESKGGSGCPVKLLRRQSSSEASLAVPKPPRVN